MDGKPHTTIRVWVETLKKLRLISALTGDRIVAIVDRLAAAELERLERDRDES